MWRLRRLWKTSRYSKLALASSIRETVTTVSLDWTPIGGWAVTRDYRVEEQVRKEQTPEDTGEIGTLNQRRQLIRSADGDARGGHRTATNNTPAGGSPATTHTSLSPPGVPSGTETPGPCPSGRYHRNMFPTPEPFPPKTTTPLAWIHRWVWWLVGG